MNTTREDIRSWLSETVPEVTEDGTPSAIALVHLNGYGQEEPVHVYKSNVAKWGDIDHMTEVFARMAERHARGIAGAQSFKLQALYGQGGVPKKIFPFTMAGALAFGALPGGGLATEPPTAVGQVSQGMRMGELVVQGMLSQIQTVFRTHGEIIAADRLRIKELEVENREMWLALKEVLMKLQEQRHDMRMKELAAARMAEFQKQIMKLAPSLLNAMAGKEVFPMSAADTELLDLIAMVASPDDIKGLTVMLKSKGVEGADALAAALNERFLQARKRKDAELAEEKRLLSDSPSRSYEEGEMSAMGRALKALKGQEAPEVPKEEPKQLQNKTGASQGPNESHTAPTQTEREAVVVEDKYRGLLADLVARIPEGEVDMLVGFLGKDDPEFAQRLKETLEELR